MCMYTHIHLPPHMNTCMHTTYTYVLKKKKKHSCNLLIFLSFLYLLVSSHVCVCLWFHLIYYMCKNILLKRFIFKFLNLDVYVCLCVGIWTWMTREARTGPWSWGWVTALRGKVSPTQVLQLWRERDPGSWGPRNTTKSCHTYQTSCRRFIEKDTRGCLHLLRQQGTEQEVG